MIYSKVPHVVGSVKCNSVDNVVGREMAHNGQQKKLWQDLQHTAMSLVSAAMNPSGTPCSHFVSNQNTYCTALSIPGHCMQWLTAVCAECNMVAHLKVGEL